MLTVQKHCKRMIQPAVDVKCRGIGSADLAIKAGYNDMKIVQGNAKERRTQGLLMQLEDGILASVK